MTKKKDLSPELKAECDAAKRLFTQKKNSLGLTQAKVAEAADISPAGVAMYLNGTNPLNAKFAVVLSRLLQEPVDRFSPRLAAELAQMQGAQVKSADSSGSTAAEKVLEMLRKHGGKTLDATAQDKIARAVADSLSEASAPTAGASQAAIMVMPGHGDISIPQYDIRAAMGHGQVPAEYSEVIRNVVIREEVLREKGVTYTAAQALAMITGWGQSMEGTINDKDPVIVDRGVNDYQGEGVYVVTWHGDLLIKRLQRKDEDHVWLISDNKNYEKQPARIDDVTIHAKVLLVWNARKV
ncbi:LexA family transcriptional regulator [Pseudomonas putida]|uniref:LexA family transcriptional regulator n=1 Tax=Pseudomonas putida TaxID=303 RepID=UPI00081959C5|nr:LexA family transcriptional regulator [Pseudomonas putida]OCT28241.1 propanediol utilization protein [Pseudomonas putida]OCT31805.1 propanediol utilization protein [Pseudomonas putida]OCT41583.1 propanediol utilization protein [Pseudomonas putida]